MMLATIVLGAGIAAFASAAKLPSRRVASTADIQNRHTDAKWWVQVGDELYTAPHPSAVQLSQKVSDYYYALGSESALTDDMRQHWVGGNGRWHIFHLPQGPSLLELNSGGDRRASFSSLMQLGHGEVLATTFPEYGASANYTHPGSSAVQDRERQAAKGITPALFGDFLTSFVALPGNGTQTRSYNNPEATHVVHNFLQQTFENMGMKVCIQDNNVIAYMPGLSRDTVTVGAHFDSRPFEGKAPGAEDNGSGVAAMLAAAKAFTEAGMKPMKSLYFVGFSSEEIGLVGSSAFAKQLAGGSLPTECQQSASFLQTKAPQQHSSIVLDEIGWLSPKYADATINLESKDWTREVMDHLASSNTMHNTPAMKVVHNANPFGSDHMSFLNHNIPAVLVINGDDEAYPNYHQSTDVISDENINMDYAAKVSRMMFGGLVRLAGLQA